MHAHEHTVDGAAQTVAHHAVDGDAIAEAAAESLILEQVRRTRHRLHAARDDDVRLAGADEQAPRFTAFSALAQTLFTVNDETLAGSPARSPA